MPRRSAQSSRRFGKDLTTARRAQREEVREMDASKTIGRIPEMKLRDTVNLRLNAMRILGDSTRRKQHRPAKQVLEAVEQEWNRRLNGPSNPDDWFRWPSTEAEAGSGRLHTEDWVQEGALQYLGYHVGNSQGEPASIREQILSRVFEGPIPPAFPPDYLKEWGKPGTAARLQKLAESIAAFTRNAKRRRDPRLRSAIRDWEADLAFLYHEYYIGRLHFGWPDSSV